MGIKEEAGRRIKAARKAAGLRLEDVFAEIPEISVSRLSNWEQGINMIGVEEAKKLAPLLKVSAGHILTIDDDVTNDPREQALVNHYRNSDERGRNQIFRVAESESKYSLIEGDDADKAA